MGRKFTGTTQLKDQELLTMQKIETLRTMKFMQLSMTTQVRLLVMQVLFSTSLLLPLKQKMPSTQQVMHNTTERLLKQVVQIYLLVVLHQELLQLTLMQISILYLMQHGIRILKIYPSLLLEIMLQLFRVVKITVEKHLLMIMKHSK